MKSGLLTGIAVLFMLHAIPSYSQTPIVKTTEQAVKKPANILKEKVPILVTERFNKEYTSAKGEEWYGYPYYDFYTDWYGYNPYLSESKAPAFYIVEFTKNTVHHKAIYSKEGKKVAVHKKVNYALPKAVSDAIDDGPYATWTMTKEKEEMFRDTEMDKMKVYKVEVRNGNEKHHLFYAIDGLLLKDKTII